MESHFKETLSSFKVFLENQEKPLNQARWLDKTTSDWSLSAFRDEDGDAKRFPELELAWSGLAFYEMDYDDDDKEVFREIPDWNKTTIPKAILSDIDGYSEEYGDMQLNDEDRIKFLAMFFQYINPDWDAPSPYDKLRGKKPKDYKDCPQYDEVTDWKKLPPDDELISMFYEE